MLVGIMVLAPHLPMLTPLALLMLQIDPAILSGEEQAWVNRYHAEIWEKVSPMLADDPAALQWLQQATKSIEA